MQARRRELFTTIRTEGAILPSDLLERVSAGGKDLGGLKPADYHLFEGEPLNEAIVRSWNRLVGAWAAFTEAREKLPEGDPGTSVTRERWLLILFDELGYGRLQPARAAEIDGKSYAVSHAWGEHVPIHLVGCNVPLDRRSHGVAGAASMSPHGLVQELLNRSEERLWGFVSNGLTLRALRDNSSLTRQAYVDFDLASMMDGDVYADFVVLWLVCHESRIEGDTPHECWLERWSQEAVKQGTRALDELRAGVEAAISALGGGFLSHPANTDLRDVLRSGELDKQEYYRELLRLVYRLLFLFVAEDRGLLFDPDATPEAAERYDRFYSTRRLRRLAERRRGSKHADLYQGLRLVMESLGEDDGCPALGLPALGGYLWSGDAVPNLGTAELPNSGLLDAARALATLEERGVRRNVDYRNLGAEELGSVYESLLELHPDLNTDAGRFELTTAAGNERKTTGSYYTPSTLISSLLDSALDPVLNEAAAKGENAVLDLKVVDPACGSGHFLVAAAHRIAKRLAALRTGDDEPSPEATRSALRDVVGRCLYGVDVNPMAVELCKVSLWMEALDPGRPLSFLDAHMKCGNSLLGTAAALVAAGIPDRAFKPLAGDDKEIAKSLRKQNKAEREGQLTLEEATIDLVVPLERRAAAIEALGDGSVTDIHTKEQLFLDLVESDDYERARLAADAWCASFVQRKAPEAPRITTGVIRRIASGRAVPDAATAEVRRASGEYGFLHWDLEFPQVFRREAGGFDVLLGNPPWDQIQYDPKEVFSITHPGIAAASTMAKRNRLLDRLKEDEPEAFAHHLVAERYTEAVQHFIHASNRFPLTAFGRLNTAPLFVEMCRDSVAGSGRVGVVVPTGIATDSFNQQFFRSLVDGVQLVSLFDFENTERLFTGIATINRFCLLTISGTNSPTPESEFVFFARRLSDLDDPERRFVLSSTELTLINPNTLTAPVFRTSRDAELTKNIYRRTPILVREGEPDENPWGLSFQLMFMMNTASHLFRTADEMDLAGATRAGNVWRHDGQPWLPLYEAKMVHQYNHRDGDYAGYDLSGGKEVRTLRGGTAEQLRDPDYVVMPRYWIAEAEVTKALRGRPGAWLLGFRDVTNTTTNRRTLISGALPRSGVGHAFPLIWTAAEGCSRALLMAALNSFVVDYVARQKIGGSHLTFFIVKQLPLVTPETMAAQAPWESGTVADWVRVRALELTYTAWDLEAFAAELEYEGPPFRWDPERRALLRAELDAAFFHLYDLAEDDVDYVMETFPIVKRRDEEKFGHYRTKALILDVYRKMADAIATGGPYETILDPPPADPLVSHQAPPSLLVGE